MILQELYVLNRVLDGQNIYGVVDFSEISISDITIDIYKEGMINKGILKDKNNFTLKGVRILSYINYYKSCEKYVTLNNLIIGKGKDGRMITLIYNPLFKEYNFFPTNVKFNFDDIIDSYEFLNDITFTEDSYVEKIEEKDLKIKYGYKKNDTLNIKIVDNGNENSFIIYAKSSVVYLYDNQNHILKIIGKNQIKDIIWKALK